MRCAGTPQSQNENRRVFFQGDLPDFARVQDPLNEETAGKKPAQKSYSPGSEPVHLINSVLLSELPPNTGEYGIELMFLDFKPLSFTHALKLHILRQS